VRWRSCMHPSRRSISRSVLVIVVTMLVIVLVACGGGSNGGGGNNNPPAPPAPLQVTTQSPLPQGIISVPYSTTTLSATGGVTPYAWNVASGNLVVGYFEQSYGCGGGCGFGRGGCGPGLGIWRFSWLMGCTSKRELYPITPLFPPCARIPPKGQRGLPHPTVGL
jgi:hypothetical protein